MGRTRAGRAGYKRQDGNTQFQNLHGKNRPRPPTLKDTSTRPLGGRALRGGDFMELSEARGRLVAIGGGDIREGDAPLLKEFIKLAKGPRARVVVMTVATDGPAAAAAEYKAAFRRLGVDDVKAVDVSSRADTLRPESLEASEHATGLF